MVQPHRATNMAVESLVLKWHFEIPFRFNVLASRRDEYLKTVMSTSINMFFLILDELTLYSKTCALKSVLYKRWIFGHLQLFTWTYLFSDISIFIDVVQVESPVEFLLDWASQEDRKAHDKVLQWKQDSPRTVQNMNCKNQNQQDKQKVKIFTMQIYSVFQLVSYVSF